MVILSIHNIDKSFAAVKVLQDIDLDISAGEIACLLGPSGCGKTTLLRIVAGLEPPDWGQVIFEGQNIVPVPVHERGFGLMFQDYALFPHQDVAANIAFGLRMHRWPAERIQQRVQEMLDLVHLQPLTHRDVNQLSGGEQQRVALARSLALQPRLLMLDEPIGALDRTLRDRLLEELRRILKRVDVTVLYVTHDQVEAFAIADRVILMRAGRVIQVGTPQKVYRQPATAWAARFLGMRNLLPGECIAPGSVQTPIGPLDTPECEKTGPLTILIRPEAAVMGRVVGGMVVEGRLLTHSFRGSLIHIAIEHPTGIRLEFDLPTGTPIPSTDEPLTLTLQPAGIVCLDEPFSQVDETQDAAVRIV